MDKILQVKFFRHWQRYAKFEPGVHGCFGTELVRAGSEWGKEYLRRVRKARGQVAQLFSNRISEVLAGRRIVRNDAITGNANDDGYEIHGICLAPSLVLALSALENA